MNLLFQSHFLGNAVNLVFKSQFCACARVKRCSKSLELFLEFQIMDFLHIWISFGTVVDITLNTGVLHSIPHTVWSFCYISFRRSNSLHLVFPHVVGVIEKQQLIQLSKVKEKGILDWYYDSPLSELLIYPALRRTDTLNTCAQIFRV